MTLRRIVLGHDSNSRSAVISDSVPATTAFRTLPGLSTALLWATEGSEGVGGPSDGADPTLSTSFLPGPGGSRLMVVVFPPDARMAEPSFDPQAFGAEYAHLLPDMARTLETDNPGMHTTDSIDYGIVLDGEVTLELDDGKTVDLKPFDVAVQLGNRHAWRNRSDRPVTLLFMLLGKPRRV